VAWKVKVSCILSDVQKNKEVGLTVKRPESLKVITLTEAIVAMVGTTIATIFRDTRSHRKKKQFTIWAVL